MTGSRTHSAPVLVTRRPQVAAAAVALLLLAIFAWASPASARPAWPVLERGLSFAERTAAPHGIAGDRRFVFVTEPGIEQPGGQGRVVVLDRRTGRAIGELPPPPGGFKLPFTLRVPRPGQLAVLDNRGFPPVGPPAVYEYRYRTEPGRFRAQLTHTFDFAGLPLFFAEDLETLPNGEYVVSESIVGALWLVDRDGRISPGLVPSGRAPLPKLGPCGFPSSFEIGGLPFAPPGLFAPGVGSLAVRGGHLYFGTSCLGGIHRLSIATLRDASRPAEDRVGEIETVSPRPKGTPAETLKGLSFNRWDRKDPYLYTGDPFRLRLLRIHARTGARKVVSADARLFNFTVATAFLPPARGRATGPLLAASDQEYRWRGLNGALDQDAFQRPFLVTKVVPRRVPRARGQR
ncbi:MAG: hypothetical protein M3N16_06200 [Actinomycetota bacterium]|nr:hypothetical protein [Actinomycetota bacterium]